MRRILVTGSSGFIGSRTVEMLAQRGESLVHLADKRFNIDLAERTSIEWIQSVRPDVILHLAGTASTPGSVERPLETFDAAVLTAVNVLEAARLIRPQAIVITSSVKARDGMTPYGASKRMVELWAEEYRVAYDLPVIINRPGTVYGPGQEGSLESGWIAWFVKAKREGLPVVVNGNGDQIRDLLYVDDYVDLMLQQIDAPATYSRGDIYDVGGGWDNAVSVNEIVKYLELEHTFGPPRYGDSGLYVGDNNLMDWKPTTGWRDGLARVLA